jgi:serine/threonine-protein phosphatase PGAM5
MHKSKLLFLNLFLLCFSLFLSSALCQNSGSDKKGTRTIYLIRHGLYNENDERDEFIGKELTPLGIAQARLLSTRLKSMSIEFSSLTSSTMTRARQTAMVINEEFPELVLYQDSLIAECTPPTWRKDVMAESDSSELTECVENLEVSFKKYFVPSPDENDRNELIVCHGNVIRYFVTKILNVNTMSWLQMSITNCSLTIIRVRADGTMKLDAFSDYGHIPENMRTFTSGENETKELLVPNK